MVRQRKDNKTLDLLTDWQPPKVTAAFAEEEVRASSLKAKISRTVAASLRGTEGERYAIAARMTSFLGETVSKNMLDAYASESKVDHIISLPRFLALAHATGDAQRLLQVLADLFDLAVIPSRYLPAIKDALIADQIEELKQRQLLERRAWKGPR